MQINYLKLKRNKGSSLLETVIYSALLAILTITTVAGLLTLNNSLQSIVLGRIVDDASQEVMEKIIREIRFADSVNTIESALSVNPSVLVLNSTDTGGSHVKVEFSINSGTLEFKRDGVLVGPLTPVQVTIDEILFDHIITPESEAVKVSLVLQASRATVFIEKTFNTTVLLRGSY
jgi:hypothetical protein